MSADGRAGRRFGLCSAVLALGAASVGLPACGATPPPAPAPALATSADAPPTDPFPTAGLAPTGLPGMGPYRLLVLAGPEVDELEVVGLAYAATLAGWRVTLAGPGGAPLRGGRGVALPLDKTFEQVQVEGYDALFAPSGAPNDPAARALVAAFGDADAPRAIVTTNAGLARLRDLPALAAVVPASPDAGVHLTGRCLVAARAGDLPALVHALDAYARVTWPRAGRRPSP